jgi:serine/threonine-protein kinase RsbT
VSSTSPRTSSNAQDGPAGGLTTDASGAVLDLLGEFLAPVIARTLLVLARRRARCDEGPLPAAALPAVAQALREAIPTYLSDPARQRACVVSLDRFIASRIGPSGIDVIVLGSERDLRVVTDTVKEWARRLGFSALDHTKLMTAAAELARNILQYAGSGEIRLSPIDQPKKGLMIVASDRGPGIDDVRRVMTPGYVSRTGMGIGLQGAKRLVDEFEITTAPGRGTVVTLRKYA